MTDISDENKPATECPAGDENCPNLRELERLRGENRELATLVRLDDLTGLYNFRYFKQAVELEMERSRRSDQSAVLIMMDIDHFKEVNDQYGHEVGNHVLANVAEIIRNTIRRVDLPCRYGGEEFAIILPDTPLSAGVLFANRLRRIIEKSDIEVDGVVVKLTASFGVDVFKKADKFSVSEFIERADSMLYAAKAKGRNQVCHLPFDVKTN